MAEQSLKDKTVKGVAWSGIDNVVQIGVTFIVTIVLARLLSPDDYGLIGIITIFTSVCTALINGGFTTALIRTKDATEEDYSTAFICNIGISVVLYGVIFSIAPLIADFFDREELVALTRVSSLSLVIGAFSLVQQTRLTKRIDFKSQTKVTLTSSVVSGVVGIIVAFAGLGVWALVVQQLLLNTLRTVLLWGINKWIPTIQFSRDSFNRLFGFGWKMMVSTLLDTIWRELYQVVVGKFYSPASLGQYTRAKQFSSLLSQNLTSVVQRVTYPVLSSIQDDRERMVSAYRRIIKVTMFVTAISMIFLGSISQPLIYCLIGEKWHNASVYLPLICVSMSLYPLHAINLNVLQVQGRSDLFLGIEIAKKIIAIGPLLIGAFVGIMPMLWANLITGLFAYFINSYYSGRFLGYSSWMQLRDVAPSYILALIIALSVYFLKFIPLSYWFILPIQLIVGAAVFILICEIRKPVEYLEVKEMTTSFINKINKKNKTA